MENPAESPRAGGPDSTPDLLHNWPFLFYLVSRVTGRIILSMQGIILSWQVYDLTGSALPLAFLGAVRFIPSLPVSFIGGAVADTQDRRVILGLSQVPLLIISVLLAVSTATGTINLTIIYVSTALWGIASAFEGPARQSLLFQVVPRARFQRAVAVATTVTQLSAVVGPTIGGFILAGFGIAPAYLYLAAIVLVGIVCLLGIRVRPGTNPSGTLSLALVKEGIAYIWSHPAVLGAMLLDMVAVIFAGADALLPIYAKDILGVGEFGYGLLNSSKAVGSLLAAVVLSMLPPITATGRVMVITVVLYGLTTIGFGLSTWFPLSLLLYGLTASWDQVSVLMRQSIIQLETPNALQGRVNSVNSLFVGASNQLGPVESGLVATWTGSAVVAAVSGGLGCIIGAAFVIALIPTLWRHQSRLEEART